MDLDLILAPNHRQYYWPQRGCGLTSDDLFDSLMIPLVSSLSRNIPRDMSRRVVSNAKNNDNTFEVSVDCSHFTPEEIEVKTVDRDVIIHGKHEEKMDKHGWVSREFTRKYTLPEECESEGVKCGLTSKGVLTISAPKRPVQPLNDNERVVPIQVIHQTPDSTEKRIQN